MPYQGSVNLHERSLSALQTLTVISFPILHNYTDSDQNKLITPYKMFLSVLRWLRNANSLVTGCETNSHTILWHTSGQGDIKAVNKPCSSIPDVRRKISEFIIQVNTEAAKSFVFNKLPSLYSIFCFFPYNKSYTTKVIWCMNSKVFWSDASGGNDQFWIDGFLSVWGLQAQISLNAQWNLHAWMFIPLYSVSVTHFGCSQDFWKFGHQNDGRSRGARAPTQTRIANPSTIEGPFPRKLFKYSVNIVAC